MQRQIKNSYEILSPSFLKFTGVCVSLYLCAISIKLFILSTIDAYQPINTISVWIIVSGVFILFVSFARFAFIKKYNGRIYLWNMYMLYCMKFILFLFILSSRAHSAYNANMLIQIALCLGFLFIFLEFLHAQESKYFAREKCILAVVMGTTLCIIHIVLTCCIIFFSGYFVGISYLVFYVFYALRIFILFLLKKEVKTYMLFECLFIAILSLLSLNHGWTGIIYRCTFEYTVILEILAVFGCTRLISQKNNIVSSLQKVVLYILPKLYCMAGKIFNAPQSDVFFKIIGIFMLTIRFAYFSLLAINIANIWRGFF